MLLATTNSPLAIGIGAIGALGVAAWLAWRLGPTLLRAAGFGLFWVAWACGSQGGYGYCAALLLIGLLAWSAGTSWYARRRGHWPSQVSATLVGRLLGRDKDERPHSPEPPSLR
jgi:hypothetical protein